MASDRKAAKGAVVHQDDDDPELDSALDSGAKLQLEIKKEDNRHKETMNQQNLGFLGNLFGDGKSLPTTAALITVVLSFIISIGLFVAAFNQPENGSMWSQNAERSLGIALAALAYVFGKSGR